MCKISLDAAKALVSGKSFSRSNTTVYQTGNISKLFLYGHLIAVYNLKNGAGRYCTCGYNTATTRDRLNAIPGLRVSMAGGTCTAIQADGWKYSANKYYATF